MIGKHTRPYRLAAIFAAALALCATTLAGAPLAGATLFSAPLIDAPPAAAAGDAPTVQAADTAGQTRAHATSMDFFGHVARSVSVDDSGHLHLLKAFGSVLLEEGAAGGTLPGQAKVRLVVGPTVTASFTIQTKYGTIYGSGRAALHSSSRYASFGGSLSVSRGTGSYARAHGSGKLYGVIDRRTSALTVQTIGTLSY